MSRLRAAALAGAALLALATPRSGYGQCWSGGLHSATTSGTREPCPGAAPGPSFAQRDAVALGVSTALGAAVAGVRAWRGERPVARAALTGAAGGAVAFGGRRLIGTSSRPGSYRGLVGRQVGAVGASVVRNAGDGRAALAGAVLPLGPFRLHVNEPRPDGGTTRLHARLDLAAAAALVYTATLPGATFDGGATLRTGAPVFQGLELRRTASGVQLGDHRAGTIGVAGWAVAGYPAGQVIPHELVHVAQYDFVHIAITEPVERALRRRAPARLERLGRHLDLGLNVGVMWLANAAIAAERRPWEHEARLLTERR